MTWKLWIFFVEFSLPKIGCIIYYEEQWKKKYNGLCGIYLLLRFFMSTRFLFIFELAVTEAVIMLGRDSSAIKSNSHMSFFSSNLIKLNPIFMEIGQW